MSDAASRLAGAAASSAVGERRSDWSERRRTRIDAAGVQCASSRRST